MKTLKEDLVESQPSIEVKQKIAIPFIAKHFNHEPTCVILHKKAVTSSVVVAAVLKSKYKFRQTLHSIARILKNAAGFK